jgi:hypothetical protein
MKRALCWLAVLGLGLAQPVRGQTGLYEFTTIAGLAGNTGTNDGPGSIARFNFPGDLTIDAPGNLYISDILNHTIRKVSPQGTNWVVTTIAGSPGNPGFADGTNTDAQFDRPNGITIDKTGILFVADHYNHTIRKITPQGTNWIVSTIAGVHLVHGDADGTNSDARFWSPTGIAVDASTNLFVVDTANFTLRKITPQGTNWVVTTIAGTPLTVGFVDATNEDAQFDYPYGITVDRANHLFVTDWGNYAIREISAIGTNWVVTTIAGTGNIGTNDGAGPIAGFNLPNGICADLVGNLFVSDQSNDTIRQIITNAGNWIVSTVAGTALQAGTTDGLGPDVRFKHPWGVAVNSAGELFVTDYGNQTIRKGVFRPSLQVSIAAGRLVLSWPASAALFTLETTSSLAPNTTWSPVTNSPVTNGLSLRLPLPPTNAPSFYRLRRP